MKRLALTFLLVLALSVSAVAQTTTTSTTLSAAVTSVGVTTFRVTSATTFAANTTWAYVDQEVVKVMSVSGTTINVLRGQKGTIPALHASGAVIYVGTFEVFRATEPTGPCTSTNERFLPQINPATGGIWQCSSTANIWYDLRRVVMVACRAQLVANQIDQQCFTADKAYAVVSITEIHAVPETGGTVTVIPKKTTGTTAIASGTALTAAAIDMVGAGAVAETLKTPALSATPAALLIAAGNRLGLDYTDDTPGELAGVTVMFMLWAR